VNRQGEGLMSQYAKCTSLNRRDTATFNFTSNVTSSGQGI
jgi:hypothetical protein